MAPRPQVDAAARPTTARRFSPVVGGASFVASASCWQIWPKTRGIFGYINRQADD